MSPLRVRVTGAFVPNYENLKARPPAVVGRKWITVDGKLALEEVDEPAELPVRAEYLIALRAGDLLAADQATADLAGVKFISTPSAAPPAAETKKE